MASGSIRYSTARTSPAKWSAAASIQVKPHRNTPAAKEPLEVLGRPCLRAVVAQRVTVEAREVEVQTDVRDIAARAGRTAREHRRQVADLAGVAREPLVRPPLEDDPAAPDRCRVTMQKKVSCCPAPYQRSPTAAAVALFSRKTGSSSRSWSQDASGMLCQPGNAFGFTTYPLPDSAWCMGPGIPIPSPRPAARQPLARAQILDRLHHRLERLLGHWEVDRDVDPLPHLSREIDQDAGQVVAVEVQPDRVGRRG